MIGSFAHESPAAGNSRSFLPFRSGWEQERGRSGRASPFFKRERDVVGITVTTNMYVVSPESPYYYNTTILVDDITTVLSGYGSAYAGEGALRLRLRLCRSLLGERALRRSRRGICL